MIMSKADCTYPILRLTAQEFMDLREYSCSYPTGTTIGKRWRRLDGSFDHKWQARGGKPFWVIGEFVDHPDPRLVKINWYRPVIIVRARRGV